MSHFYGIVRGQAPSEGTRRGNKANGLRTIAASWEGAVTVDLFHDEKSGRDYAEVRLMPWQGVGCSRLLFRGPVNGRRARPGMGTHQKQKAEAAERLATVIPARRRLIDRQPGLPSNG